MRRDRPVVASPPARRGALALLAAAAALGAGCAATRNQDGEIVPSTRDPGLTAPMQSKTSAVVGTVRVFNARDGVTLQAFFSNLMPGTYRIALHERGNCTSPNLFSAGPAWAPPGSSKAPGELLPPFVTNSEGTEASFVAFIAGVCVDGPTSIRGRSVVLHWGGRVDDAFPGQPNNRLSCGVLETGTVLRF